MPARERVVRALPADDTCVGMRFVGRLMVAATTSEAVFAMTGPPGMRTLCSGLRPMRSCFGVLATAANSPGSSSKAMAIAGSQYITELAVRFVLCATRAVLLPATRCRWLASKLQTCQHSGLLMKAHKLHHICLVLPGDVVHTAAAMLRQAGVCRVRDSQMVV